MDWRDTQRMGNKSPQILFSTRTGLAITRTELMDEGIPCINYGEIHSKYNFDLDLNRDYLKNAPIEFLENKVSALTEENDFIFCDTSEDIDGSGNNVYIKNKSGKKLFAGSHTIILHPIIKANSKYLAYLFATSQWRSQIRSKVYGVKVFSITQTILKDTKLILPQYNTQQAIADYLDRKTSAIDSLIEDKQKLIELLKEKRQAIISEAVTKGLDKTAKMKNSGVEWIGDIPEGWEVKRIKYVYNIRKAKLPSMLYDEKQKNSKIYLSMDIIRGKTSDGYYALDGDLAKESDLLLLCDGSNSGEIICLHLEGYAPSTTAILRTKLSIDENYAKFYMKIIEVRLRERTIGMGVPHVDGDYLKSLPFLLPDKENQKIISSYLEKKIYNIDILLKDITEQIETLKEYHQAIISEAVTGKVAI